MRMSPEHQLLQEEYQALKVAYGILTDRLEASLQANASLQAQLTAITRHLERQTEQHEAERSRLQSSVDTLTAAVTALTEKLGKAGADIASLNLRNKRLGEMVDGKHSEKSGKSKGAASPCEEPQAQETPETPKAGANKSPKDRGNNGARRSDHPECEEENIEVMPASADFDKDKARYIGKSVVTRYYALPMRFRKVNYIVHKYIQEGRVVCGEVPVAPLNNSNFDSSFIASLAELRYIYSMPVQRIVKYFREKGFDISKSTANGLLKKAGQLIEMFHRAIKETVGQTSYAICDETYMKVITAEPRTKGIHSKKAYFWTVVDKISNLVLFMYDTGKRTGADGVTTTNQALRGSRSEELILDFFSNNPRVTIQSDGFKVYRKMGSELYPNITRIACLQHIVRKFRAEGSPRAMAIVGLFEKIRFHDKEHRPGCDGWTNEDHRRWRQQYAPPLLLEIEAKLIELQADTSIPPDGELARAVTYALNEWRDVEPIFREGFHDLDTNAVERQNRYISLSRRNSLFHGSHDGAEIGAVYYTLACSCRNCGVNFHTWLSDILNRCCQLPPTAKPSTLRHLLPDRWEPQSPRQ